MGLHQGVSALAKRQTDGGREGAGRHEQRHDQQQQEARGRVSLRQTTAGASWPGIGKCSECAARSTLLLAALSPCAAGQLLVWFWRATTRCCPRTAARRARKGSSVAALCNRRAAGPRAVCEMPFARGRCPGADALVQLVCSRPRARVVAASVAVYYHLPRRPALRTRG